MFFSDAVREFIGSDSDTLEAKDHRIFGLLQALRTALQLVVIELEASDEAFFKANGLLLRNTFAINYLDGCAFTLPCHVPGELPVGLMLASTAGDDARLAAAALAIEAVLNPLRS